MTDGRGLTEGVKGEDCTFTVITKDLQGNKTYSEIDGVEVCIQSLQTGKSVKVTITDSQDGCYRVSYKPEATGQFNVVITVAGEAIKGSPFQLKVEERKGRQESKWDWEESKDALTTRKKENLFRGNQPVEYITWKTESNNSLPGYEKYGTIVITYNFKEEVQGPDHPNPGEPYSGLFCTSYLPNNPAGQDLCKLLRSAFLARLLFTIGKCPVTGEENKIVSNGIELKWNRSGGPANCGYPDPSYLDRVKSQLAERGITQFLEYE